MAKDERKKKKKRRGGGGGDGGVDVQAINQEEEEEEEEPPTTTAEDPKHKLKLVLKLPRSYLNPDSAPHPNNSSSSSLPLAPRGGGGEGGGAAGGGLSDTLSSPTPRREDVTVAHRQTGVLPEPSHGDSASSESAVSSYGASEDGEKPPKKRKLNAVAEPSSADGSALAGAASATNGSAKTGSALRRCNNKMEKQSQSLEVTEPVPGTPSDPQSGTPIPDKKVLELILDKLQKKDTYGVFSEPVDPKELPDYHDIIQNPMDFGTIRKKLAKGVYPDLEHFEKDVFLICTNAMRYNASETVYYRQARSIQELARKNFQSLRLDPEGFEVELKPASKGKSNYSSKKWTKKPGLRRYPLEPAGSDFSSGATLATGGDHTKLSNASLHDSTKIRKVVASERPGNVYGYSDITARNLQGYHSADGIGPSTEMKAEKSEELSASMPKVSTLRNGRRPLLLEENRRGTYKPSNQLENGNESIFSTLDRESKQLVPMGIRSEYAYARSLARFAANLGPVAWKIAAQKIQRVLPSGVSFGRGWAGDYEAPPRSLLPNESNSPPISASPTTMPMPVGEKEIKLNNYADRHIAKDEGLSKNLVMEGRSGPLTATSASANKSVSISATYQRPENRSSAPFTQSDANKCAGLKFSGDARVNLSSQEIKQGQMKPVSPIAKSNDLGLTGAKFPPEVTQSRLLEMVSRNNALMTRTSFKQADGSRPISNLQVANSGHFTIDNDAGRVARDASDGLKRLSSSAGINVAVTGVSSSLSNFEAGSGAFQASQSTSSQEHGVQESNRLPSIVPGKMLGLHQRGSNMSANTPVFGHSSVPSTGASMKREDSTVQTWMRSRSADLSDADAMSRIKMQNTPKSHLNTEQHESPAREFSVVSRFMQQEIPLDMSRQALSQLGRLHPQNSVKFSHTTGVSDPMVESQHKMTPLSCVQTSVGADSSKSHIRPWRGLPSQYLSQQTSDLASSIPPDLNVGFQNPKSPAQQSSGMLADSQQPDLALQL
eukprot:Gb_36938 [translate_table: standard]